MSASAGSGGMMSGGIMNLVQNWLTGGTPGGTALGQQTPEWEFPNGPNSIPDDIRSAFFRSDFGPTGFNEFLMQIKRDNPALLDRFRAYVNGGLIVPKNQAAQQTVMANGGYQAGDMTPLGTMINGMPSGLNESQLNTLANIIGSGIQYNLGLIEASGYLDGVPTLDRENIIGQLAQGWMEQATNQFLAGETQRSNMAQEGLSQQEITNQNIQSMAEIFGGMVQTDPATGQTSFQPTEKAREFDTTQSGWLNGEATLTREQQAFNQAKDVANLASNPRNYIEAQMLQNARGGLTGMEPNNQIKQETFGPATTTQQPQFQAPGGAQNQMQNLATMQGQPAAAGAAGGQGAAPGASPQAMGATSNYNLNNPDTWAQMGNQAGQQWGTAQQGLQNLQNSSGFQSLMPQQNTPGGPGQGPAPWPGLPTGWGQPQNGYGGLPSGTGTGSQMERELTSIDDSNWTPEQRAQWEERSRQSSQQAQQMAMQERMRAMGQLPGKTGMEGLTPWNQAGAAGTGDQGAQPGGTTEPWQGSPLPNATAGGMDMDRLIRGLPGAGGTGMQDMQRGELLTKPMPGMGQTGWQGLTNPFQPNPGQGQAGVQPAGQANQYGSLSSLTALRGAGQSPAQRLAASRQDVAGANQGQKFATSNFTQSLLQNRVVPKSGGLNTAGKYMSANDMASGVNPNKIRTQDYLRGDPSQQQGFQAVGSMAGYSGEDLQSIMQKNLPSFKAPGAGRMI